MMKSTIFLTTWSMMVVSTASAASRTLMEAGINCFSAFSLGGSLARFYSNNNHNTFNYRLTMTWLLVKTCIMNTIVVMTESEIRLECDGCVVEITKQGHLVPHSIGSISFTRGVERTIVLASRASGYYLDTQTLIDHPSGHAKMFVRNVNPFIITDFTFRMQLLQPIPC